MDRVKKQQSTTAEATASGWWKCGILLLVTQVTEVTHETGCAKHSSLAFLATLSARCRRRVRPLRSRQGVDTTPEEKNDTSRLWAEFPNKP